MPGFSNISYSKHANTKKANFFVSSRFILKITVQQSASDIGESILWICLRNIVYKMANFNFWQLSPKRSIYFSYLCLTVPTIYVFFVSRSTNSVGLIAVKLICVWNMIDRFNQPVSQSINQSISRSIEG